MEYLENEKSFFDEKKKALKGMFEGLSFGEKKKKMIQNCGCKL